jgi:hypothetical protein
MAMENNPEIFDMRTPKRNPQAYDSWIETRLNGGKIPNAQIADIERQLLQAEKMARSLGGPTPELDAKIQSLKKRLAEIKS